MEPDKEAILKDLVSQASELLTHIEYVLADIDSTMAKLKEKE